METTNQDTVVYRAAVYVRLSKEDIDSVRSQKLESDSISNQKQLIFNFLKNKSEINIVSIREDDGYTGTDYDRPAFQLMLDDIKAGRINCVVIKDLSRFGREYIDAGKYIHRLFPYYGVRLISVNDGIDTVTMDSSAELGITIRNLFNDSYCRDISIKIRSHLKVKRSNGEFIGAFAPYGYKRSETERNRLLIDEYPATVVQDIFKWKLKGMSQDAIAKKLNEQDVLSPMEYKRNQGLNYKSGFKIKERALWSSVAVRRILQNKVYIGTLIQGVRTTPNYKIKTEQINDKEDWCVVEENHEAIISERHFVLVQRLLGLDTRTSPKEEVVFPLAGLLVCGDCLCTMIKKLTSSGGKKYGYYLCSKHKHDKSCSSHRMKDDKLEEAVFKIVQNHIRMIMEMEQCLDFIGKIPYRRINLKKAQERLIKIDEEISRYRRLKVTLYEDWKSGIVNQVDYSDISGQYELRVQNAEQGKVQIKKEMDLLMKDATEQQIWMKDFIQHRKLEKLTRIVAVELIEQVQVYEDKKIQVIFRHAQDFERLASQIEEFSSLQSGAEKEAI